MAYYNKLRDKFRTESGLPDGLAWDLMENGIYEKMGKKEKKRRLIIWWFIPILALTAMMIYWYTSKDHTIISATNSNEVIAHHIEQKASTQKSKPLEKSNLPNSDVVKNEIDIKDYNDVHALPDAKQKKQIKETTRSKASNQNVLIIENIDCLKSHEDRLNYSPDVVVDATTHHDHLSTNEQERLAINELLHIVPIRSLFRLSHQIQHQNPETITLMPTIIPDKLENKKYLGLKDLMVSAGYTHWNLGSTTSNNINIENFVANSKEKELPSYHVSIRGDLMLSKHFLIFGSLDYQKLVSVFDYSGMKTKPVELNNVVIKIEENLLSGEKSFIRGNATVNETTNRTIRHRNEQDLVLFAAGPGTWFEYNRWTINAHVGMYVSIYHQGNGKTFYNDDIVEYDGAIPLYNQKTQLGFNTGLSCKYRLNDQYFLHSAFTYQKSFNNLSSDPLRTTKPIFTNISLGMGVQF